MTGPPEPSMRGATADPGLGCRGWRSLGRCGQKATAIRRWKNWPPHAIPMSCAWLLVQSPWGWGSSTRHGEAISLLRGLRGGTLPGSLVALLLCTCRRWDRVTAKLIAAVEECGVLSGPDLDELAESLLSDEVVAVFPLAWISGQWLELGAADGTTRTVQVSDEAVARDERRVEPPLRRWAAARALRNDPARLEELLACADGMTPRHRDALLHGLLDAADGLDAGQCRQLVGRALRSGIARVRRAALDRRVSSTGRERRCAAPGRTLIGRCALGARPARLHRRRRSCRALHHRSREGTKFLRGWLVVMCGAAILLAAKLRRPCNGCSHRRRSHKTSVQSPSGLPRCGRLVAPQDNRPVLPRLSTGCHVCLLGDGLPAGRLTRAAGGVVSGRLVSPGRPRCHSRARSPPSLMG